MLTVKQAAERLGVSPSLVYTLVAARRLRHERIGIKRGVIRIPLDALEDYRRTCEVGVAVAMPARPRVRLNHLKLR